MKGSIKMKEMTTTQKTQCHEIIHLAAAAAGGIGLSPIPFSDTLPLVTVQTTMILALGKVFNVKIEESYATSIAKTAIAKQVGKLIAGQFAKLIPGFGNAMNAGVAFTMTELLGWDTANDFFKMSQYNLAA